MAETFTALESVHQSLKAGTITKEYVCWVKGRFAEKAPRLFCDNLVKDDFLERMEVVCDKGRQAKSLVWPLRLTESSSLLLVRILTGRTHQIRVQLAHAGYPVLGDAKYGVKLEKDKPLFLHACRLRLADGFVCTDLPNWPAPYACPSLPQINALDDLLGAS